MLQISSTDDIILVGAYTRRWFPPEVWISPRLVLSQPTQISKRFIRAAREWVAPAVGSCDFLSLPGKLRGWSLKQIIATNVPWKRATGVCRVEWSAKGKTSTPHNARNLTCGSIHRKGSIALFVSSASRQALGSGDWPEKNWDLTHLSSTAAAASQYLKGVKPDQLYLRWYETHHKKKGNTKWTCEPAA